MAQAMSKRCVAFGSGLMAGRPPWQGANLVVIACDQSIDPLEDGLRDVLKDHHEHSFIGSALSRERVIAGAARPLQREPPVSTGLQRWSAAES